MKNSRCPLFSMLSFHLIMVMGFHTMGLRGDELPKGAEAEFSGRIRSLSMTRDYEDKGTGANSTLGVMLQASTPISEQFQVGATYIQAEEVGSRHQSDMLSNNDIRILNEAWIRFKSDLYSIQVDAGRMIVNDEIFRKDDSRQKPRAVEAAVVKMPGFHVGHALRMSNYFQVGDRWEFNSFDKVFGSEDDSAGLTWAEVSLPVSESLSGVVYNAYVWDLLNLSGLRMDWSISDTWKISGLARSEQGLKETTDHQSEIWGLSLHHKMGAVNVETGVLSVHGDNMQLQETSTGFNHPLASTMIIYTRPYDGGADTLYVKATTKVGETSLYFLGMVSQNDEQPYDAEEINVVLKTPLTEQLEIAIKGAVGYRDQDEGPNTTATDARFFVTYTF